MNTFSINKFLLLVIIFLFCVPTIILSQISQEDWQLKNQKSLKIAEATAFKTLPFKFQLAEISTSDFYKKLKKNNQEITLPMTEGTYETYIIEPSEVNAPEVAHLYTIKTFTGHLKGNPNVKMACDISPLGFHAIVYAEGHTTIIGPTSNKGTNKHIIYNKQDHRVEKAGCHVTEIENLIEDNSNLKFLIPAQKRTYRLAVSATWEYAQQFGGAPYNVTNVLNAITSGINIMNPIFLRDLGITFTNVTNASIIFQNQQSDPYSRPFGGTTINVEIPNQINTNIGAANYDVGHLVIWLNEGGLAGPDPCDDADKARGYSGSDASVTTLWIDYVAHEIGHQFGMPHNFSNSCGGNGEDGFRYEPGEGSSIMSYANSCGAQDETNYSNGSDPFFAITSINSAQPLINGHACPTTDATGNASDPVITQPGNITIPKQTPFILVGSATDANDPNNNLTYAWEQNDGNGPVTVGPPTGNGTSDPLFRFRVASANNYRHFPEFPTSLAGNNISKWERLSNVARTINFSFTVRDNNASFGRLSEANNAVTVADTGPFNVTAPNGGETVNATTTVTWTVNGTDAHCANVDILVSTDGGTSFTVVANATANDGSELITLPAGTSTMARVLVRCDVAGGFRSASTFYDVSDANFTMGGGGVTQGHTCATAIQINAAGTYNAPAADQGGDVGDPGVATNAIWYLFTPPMTGMINVTSCNIPANNGIMGGGHNHVYPPNTNCANVQAVITNGTGVFTTANSCGNQTATNDIPVTAGMPILIEWDDAVGGAAFTWNLEYVNNGGCPVDVTVSADAMGNTLASNSIMTQGMVAANTAVFSAPTVNMNGGFSVPNGQCFEVNNVGCAYMGTLNCDSGGNQGMGTCAAPYVLTCGTPFMGDLTGGTSAWNEYTDGGMNTSGANYPGPERIHTLVIPATQTRTITLSGFANDLDFFVATTCAFNTVFTNEGAVEGDNTNETAIIQNNGGGPLTIYIIVDGWDGDVGPYTLSCN